MAVLVVAMLAGGGLLLLVGAEGFSRLHRLYLLGGEQHWDRLAARVGLLHGHDVLGGHVLDGLRQGVWLHVEAEGAWMVIRGRIEARMPRRFGVTRCRYGAAEGIAIGSPILDGLIRAQGDTPTAQLLQDPELAGALLAVVHAWPGSSVDERHVTLRYPDTLGRRLDARCEEVIALVEALRVAARRCCAAQEVASTRSFKATLSRA